MLIFILAVLSISAIIITYRVQKEKKYKELENEVLDCLGFPTWNIISYTNII